MWAQTKKSINFIWKWPSSLCVMAIISTAAPCMCLKNKVADCDGHLLADSVKRAQRLDEPTQSAGHVWHYSEISFRRTDGSEFPPFTSFLQPFLCCLLSTFFVPQRFIKASLKNHFKVSFKNRSEGAQRLSAAQIQLHSSSPPSLFDVSPV